MQLECDICSKKDCIFFDQLGLLLCFFVHLQTRFLESNSRKCSEPNLDQVLNQTSLLLLDHYRSSRLPLLHDCFGCSTKICICYNTSLPLEDYRKCHEHSMFDVLPNCIGHIILFHLHLLQQSCCPSRYRREYLRQLHSYASTSNQTSLCNQDDTIYLDQSIVQALRPFLTDSCVVLYIWLCFIAKAFLSLQPSSVSFIKFSHSDPDHSC